MLFQSTKETLRFINESWQAKETLTETIALVITKYDILASSMYFWGTDVGQNPT